MKTRMEVKSVQNKDDHLRRKTIATTCTRKEGLCGAHACVVHIVYFVKKQLINQMFDWIKCIPKEMS